MKSSIVGYIWGCIQVLPTCFWLVLSPHLTCQTLFILILLVLTWPCCGRCHVRTLLCAAGKMDHPIIGDSKPLSSYSNNQWRLSHNSRVLSVWSARPQTAQSSEKCFETISTVVVFLDFLPDKPLFMSTLVYKHFTKFGQLFLQIDLNYMKFLQVKKKRLYDLALHLSSLVYSDLLYTFIVITHLLLQAHYSAYARKPRNVQSAQEGHSLDRAL